MKYIVNLFKGRINRRNYLLGLLFYLSLSMCSIVIVEIISSITSGSCNYPNNYNYPICGMSVVLYLVAFLLPIIFSYSLIVRRLHDLGWSAWSSLLLLVPFVNIYLYFCLYFGHGHQSDNKYGSKPSQKIRFPADILNLSISGEKKSNSCILPVIDNLNKNVIKDKKPVSKVKILFLIIICLCLITIALSIAYYFVLFLPQQQRDNAATLKKIEQSTQNTEENTQNIQDTQSTPDNSDMQDQLDNINNTLQQQQQETDSRNRCEDNGGKYLGNGACCISNCANVQ
ncbi:MAG TPA: DUF805 domain-containing protein [Patescibacteria group bacterium]|nr:DUF805 domain-containing protein [Patescibacteria group bacterium]